MQKELPSLSFHTAYSLLLSFDASPEGRALAQEKLL